MKKILKFSNNKLIFILCLIIATGGLFAAKSFAQEGSTQTVQMTGYSFRDNPDTIFDFGVIVSKIFVDTDNTDRFLDPAGETRLEALIVTDGIVLDYDAAMVLDGRRFLLRNAATDYHINFADFGTAPGYARFNYLRAQRFHMEDDGPYFLDAQRGGGKYVYDIAETIKVADGQAADVVIISEDKDITVVKSNKKFDTKVAGVISTDPKIYMGYSPKIKESKEYKPLALARVVLCKVTAENGAIKKGDILVTSSIPGHAMRADPDEVTTGMILGSALGSLEEGQGKIYILVN
jgi:hypothetical protein